MRWICDPDADEENDEKYWVNLRGNIGFLRKSLIEKIPESSLAAMFEGKLKSTKYVEGLPFLDKDP